VLALQGLDNLVKTDFFDLLACWQTPVSTYVNIELAKERHMYLPCKCYSWHYFRLKIRISQRRSMWQAGTLINNGVASLMIKP